MAILVTGGFGYIGSHTVLELLDLGYEVVVVDDLRETKLTINGPFHYNFDLANETDLRSVFDKHNIEAVIHFAASSLVGQSVSDPIGYYENNIGNTLNLLKIMNEFNVKKLVVSSSSAVYGDPLNIPVSEDERLKPKSPYGETKLVVEKLVNSCHVAYGINAILLRYFNAAGAHPLLKAGESRKRETHLIPSVLNSIIYNEKFEIYGEDYETDDGTCIRDYLHVMDLASAHILALNKLTNFKGIRYINLGTGKGYSVKEVIKAAEKVTGEKVKIKIASKRDGDPPVLVASKYLAEDFLGWQIQCPSLEAIIKSSWNWELKKPRQNA